MTNVESPKKPTVLIVEDEMLLRMRAADIVEDAGFTSLEAVNADDAMVLLESRSDIELLFTDIQMPGSMNGLKLAHAVHKRWPAIKIIIVSGQVTPTEEDRPTDSRFFGKPLEARQIIAELQAMIGLGNLKIISTDIINLPIFSEPAIAGDDVSKNIDRGKRHSAALAGTGWHRRTDALSSSRHRRKRA